MPSPTVTPMNIAIKSSSATYEGEKVKVWNITRSQFIIGTFNSEGECVFNPKDTYSDWESGDSIQVEVNGRLQGVKSGTLTSKGINIVVSTSAIAESATVNLSVNM